MAVGSSEGVGGQAGPFTGVWQCVGTTGEVPASSIHLWVQTPTLYCRLRLPPGRRRLVGSEPGAHSAALEHCLAGQGGSAGRLLAHGKSYEWQPLGSYQPVVGSPWYVELMEEGEFVVERRGEDTLRWRRLIGADQGWCALAADGETDAWGAVRRRGTWLLVVGDYFIYFRDRPHPLRAGAGLDHQWETFDADTRLAALDCEISFGNRLGGTVPWQVETSTLPAREGASLFPPGSFPVCGTDGTCVQHSSRPNGSLERRWRVVECTRQPEALW